MAHYVIGDVQGCFDELQLLLQKIDFNYGSDTLWLTGDIVNRGPKSLATIRFVMLHDDCIQTVLGNHDLHLLAVAFGEGRVKKGDTINDILQADDKKILLDWLRRQPLMIRKDKNLLVHAGLLPQWSANEALSLASDVEIAISGSAYRKVFANMYGNKPARYRPELQGMDRLRLIMNVMTRMRIITDRNKLDFDFKATYEDIPEGLCAWFDAKNRRHADHTVIFGHWSALGLYQKNNVICLDTGALWGGALTALNLDSGEIIQVPSLNGGIPLK
ncbi:MAG: symmetrical bis(5'-nucleosyl)-tetraphosphatase [Neisseriaceae bacterium]|nr:symmetrical bis(5'-nucleosyl)-tetraphosphatase [Neisseriaceae bacterium]